MWYVPVAQWWFQTASTVKTNWLNISLSASIHCTMLTYKDRALENYRKWKIGLTGVKCTHLYTKTHHYIKLISDGEVEWFIHKTASTWPHTAVSRTLAAADSQSREHLIHPFCDLRAAVQECNDSLRAAVKSHHRTDGDNQQGDRSEW